MRLNIISATLFLTALFASQNATAFSVDDKSGNNPDGSAKFSDSDDSVPGGAVSTDSQNPEIQRLINNQNH